MHYFFRAAFVAGLVGATVAGSAFLPWPVRGATTTPVTTTTAPAPAAPLTLPVSGQFLVHEFTTSAGAACVVVLTAASVDPKASCVLLPEAVPTTTAPVAVPTQ